MADPLSIASSVAGLITITAQIATKAGELWSSFHGAPGSVQKIQEEMDEMNTIFCQVRQLLRGATKSNYGRLTMISLHHLMATLSGCVLLCSKLNKKLHEVPSIRHTGNGSIPQDQSVAELGKKKQMLDRMKWTFWTEAEVAEIIEDLQRYKLSLSLMLNIVQCNKLSEASESMVQLHEIVGKILESNHAMSIQLRELINYHKDCPALNQQPTKTHTESSCTPGTETRPSGSESPMIIESPSSPSRTNSDENDNVSIKTTHSTFSIRSLSLPSFTQDLLNSRAYKRLRYFRQSSIGSSSNDSIFSMGSSTKGQSWSMLSNMSLGELSISEISVLELPITLSNLQGPEIEVYQQALVQVQAEGYSKLRLPRRRVKWASLGMLHNAIANRNRFAIRTLLNLGADIDEVHRGSTPLIVAHAAGNIGSGDIVTLLLDRGASIDKRDRAGRTPLSHAVMILNVGQCLLLLDRGADVNSIDSRGRSPLSYAASRRENLGAAICQLLLDKGALVDLAGGSSRTPLSYAEDSRTCKLLIMRGASVDSQDTTGRTSLSYAAENHQEQSLGICETLLNSGAHIDLTDNEGWTPLKHAVMSDSPHLTSICKLLLERGAEVEQIDIEGRTLLSHAVTKESQLLLCELLLDHGAKVDKPDSIGRTPLSYAAGALKQYNFRLAVTRNSNILDAPYYRLFTRMASMASTACVDSTDSIGRTALSYASQTISMRLCETLLNVGAIVDLPDTQGRTPLSYAAEVGLRETCAYLVTSGASVDLPDSKGRTPLSWATNSPTGSDLVEWFIAQGAKVDSLDSYGCTPLSHAANGDRLSVCKTLVVNGADTNLRDFGGKKPGDHSYREEICKLLLSPEEFAEAYWRWENWDE